MGKFIDLTGQKFGRLTVLYRGEKVKSGQSVKWYCKCDCGNYCWVDSGSLKSGNTKSCGCYKLEIVTNNGRKKLGKRKKFNLFLQKDDYVIGYDDKGNSFYIDKEDLGKVQKYCWYKNNSGYWTTSYTSKEGQKHLSLHKFLTNTDKEQIIDHHDRNKDNNRKYNLVFADSKLNARNSSLAKNNTSGIIGVSFHKKEKNGKPL